MSSNVKELGMKEPAMVNGGAPGAGIGGIVGSGAALITLYSED